MISKSIPSSPSGRYNAARCSRHLDSTIRRKPQPTEVREVDLPSQSSSFYRCSRHLSSMLLSSVNPNRQKCVKLTFHPRAVVFTAPLYYAYPMYFNLSRHVGLLTSPHRIQYSCFGQHLERTRANRQCWPRLDPLCHTAKSFQQSSCY